MGIFEIRKINQRSTGLFDLESEALIASGVEKDKIYIYREKFSEILYQLLPRNINDFNPLKKARIIFHALWKDKPHRYMRKGPFKFHQVIDAQLENGDGPVGNCLGLTLLYNTLLKRSGIQVQAVYIENAFGTEPHVLTLLEMENTQKDIENILPDGFDYKGHKKNPSRQIWGDKELVADIYQSKGTEFFQQKNFEKALKYYNLALKLNPKYQKAYLNILIVFSSIKKKDKDEKN